MNKRGGDWQGKKKVEEQRHEEEVQRLEEEVKQWEDNEDLDISGNMAINAVEFHTPNLTMHLSNLMANTDANVLASNQVRGSEDTLSVH